MGHLIFGEQIPGKEYRGRRAAYALIFEQGQVGTVRTQRGHFLPGGGLEGNESPEEAVRRELLEETGYVLTHLRFVGEAVLYEVSDRAGALRSLGYFFLAEVGERLHSGQEADHELVWLEPARAVELLLMEHQVWAVRTVCQLETEPPTRSSSARPSR